METRKHHFISTPILAAIGRFGGMLIPIVIAFVFGATRHTDAFFLAFALTFFFLSLIQQIFESLLLPFLSEHKLNDASQIVPFVLRILKVLLPLLVITALAVWLFLKSGLNRGSGFNAETAGETARLFLCMLPFLLFSVLVSALNGILNSYKYYWLPAVSPALRSLGVIAAIFLFHQKMGIYAIALGFVLGELLRLWLSVYLVQKLKLLSFSVKSDSQSLRLFWHQCGFQLAALIAVQMIPLMNQWFATWLQTGDVSLYSYADRLYLIPYQIFLMGVSQIFLSDWSDSYVQKTAAEFRAKVINDVRLAVLVASGISAILLLGGIFAKPLFQLVLSVDAEQAGRVASVFNWLILGFAPAVMTSLLLRVLFVMKTSVHFFIQSMVRLAAQVVLILLLLPLMGLTGIAGATTLSTLFSAVWLFFMVKKIWQAEDTQI